MQFEWKWTRIVMFLATAMLLVLSPMICPAQNDVKDQEPQEAPDEAGFEEVRREMRELGQALGRYGAEQRDKAVERSRPALEDLDRRLNELDEAIQNNWEEMSEAARERSRRTMRELRRQRLLLAEQYGALKSSTEDAWEQVRESFLDAFSDVNEAWKETIREFRKKNDHQGDVTL